MKHRTCKGFLSVFSLFLAMLLFLFAAPVYVFAASGERKIVNVVFVIDTTASMGDEISNVKNNLSEFSSYLKNRDGLDELRIGLIDFGDYEIGEKTVVHKSASGSPWYENVDELISEIGSIDLGNGGDADETPFDGLGYLVCGSGYTDALPFNSDAYKFAFLLTDAGYKVDNRFGITGKNDMVNRLKEAGIYTSVVTSSSLQGTYSELYSYAPNGAVTNEEGEPFTGEWMDINGDFSKNMKQFADRILDVVRPDIEEITMEVGAKFNFYSFAAAYLSNPDAATYSTDNSAIVSLGKTSPNIGTAMMEGNCIITITDGKDTVRVEVTVKQAGDIVVPVKELHISAEVYVGVDQSIYIKATALPEEATEKGLIWRVDNDSVVQIVSQDGNLCYLKGLRNGTARLTALTVDGGYSGTTTITVTLDPIVYVTGVELSMSDCTLEIGASETVTGTVLPETATNRGGYWYSSDPSVVRIDTSDAGSCTFSAVTCGEAKIYFVSDDGGFSKAVDVTVPHHAQWTVTKPATCMDGEKLLICDYCHTILDSETIPATGDHSLTEWTPVLSEEDGTLKQIERSCKVCGEYTETADVGAYFYTNKLKGKSGETLEMEICLRGGSHLSDFQLTFRYDTELFDIEKVTFSEKLSAPFKNASIDKENGKIVVIYSGTEMITEEMPILKVTFSLNKNVSYKVTNVLTLDDESHNICHTMLEGTTYVIGCELQSDFGELTIYGPDPNGDGELNIYDLYDMLLVLTSADYDPYDPELLDRMDCNGDGVFDVADITYLQYIITYMDRD